jgi:hypothetical protein
VFVLFQLVILLCNLVVVGMIIILSFFEVLTAILKIKVDLSSDVVIQMCKTINNNLYPSPMFNVHALDK